MAGPAGSGPQSSQLVQSCTEWHFECNFHVFKEYMLLEQLREGKKPRGAGFLTLALVFLALAPSLRLQSAGFQGFFPEAVCATAVW